MTRLQCDARTPQYPTTLVHRESRAPNASSGTPASLAPPRGDGGGTLTGTVTSKPRLRELSHRHEDFDAHSYVGSVIALEEPIDTSSSSARAARRRFAGSTDGVSREPQM